MELGKSSLIIFGESFVLGSFNFNIVDLLFQMVNFGIFGFNDFVSVSG
jgi:hypothetical protein